MRRFGIMAVVVAVLLPILAYTGYLRNQSIRERERLREERRRWESENGKPPLGTLSVTPETRVLAKTAKGYQVKTFAEIPSGQMVEVSDVALSTRTPVPASEAARAAEQGETWRIIKYDGRPYLRAYLPAPLSASVVQKGNIWLTSVSCPGYQYASRLPPRFPDDMLLVMQTRFVAKHPTPVTIPLDGLQYEGEYGGGRGPGICSKNILTAIATDSHLFEKWTDPKGILKQ